MDADAVAIHAHVVSDLRVRQVQWDQWDQCDLWVLQELQVQQVRQVQQALQVLSEFRVRRVPPLHFHMLKIIYKNYQCTFLKKEVLCEQKTSIYKKTFFLKKDDFSSKKTPFHIGLIRKGDYL